MTKLLDFDLTKDTLSKLDVRYNQISRFEQDGKIMSLLPKPNDRNHEAIEIQLPGRHGEIWTMMKVRFTNEDTFGRNTVAHRVGGKMPGQGCSGNHSSMSAGHTGSNHDKYGCSARLMWRPWNASGNGNLPADAFTLSLYASHLRKKSDNFFFRKNNMINPPNYQGGGTGPGELGDPDIWLAPVGEWITIITGMGVGKNHFYKAYTATESAPVPALRLSLTHGSGFRWMADEARQVIDSFVFQSLWGGSASEIEWQPTSQAGPLEYTDINVHTSNPISSGEAVTAPKPKEPTVLSIDSGLGGDYALSFDLSGDTGEETIVIEANDKDLAGAIRVESAESFIVSITNVDKINHLRLRFTNDGKTAGGVDKNLFFNSLVVSKDGVNSIINDDHPALYSNAGYDKDGPTEGPNSLVNHKGRMYRSGELRFQNALIDVGALVPTPVSPPPVPVQPIPDDSVPETPVTPTPGAETVPDQIKIKVKADVEYDLTQLDETIARLQELRRTLSS